MLARVHKIVGEIINGSPVLTGVGLLIMIAAIINRIGLFCDLEAWHSFVTPVITLLGLSMIADVTLILHGQAQKQSTGTDQKTLDEVYRQRLDVWMLAMALAQKQGHAVGVRYDNDSEEAKKWPCLVIEDLPGGEVSIHAKREDVHPVLLKKFPTNKAYDGSTDADKRKRIWKALDAYWK